MTASVYQNNTTKTRLAIIADDFTGSNDTGVQFSKKGFKTGLIMDISGNEKALYDFDILAIDTESRADSKDTASEKVFRLASTLKETGIPYLYKKLDSTMRGNIGAELEAALRGFDSKAVIAVPAYPSNGRVTKDGICFVHGVKLAETEFALNQVNTVTSSYIPEIICTQTSLKTKTLGLDIVRGGKDTIVRALRSLIAGGTEIVIADALNDNDLTATASALPELEMNVIYSGSSAFAEHIADSLGTSADIPKSKPILVVAGSVTEATRAQIEYALEKDYLLPVEIDISLVLNGNEDAEISRIVETFSKPGAISKHILIWSARNSEDVRRAFELGKRNGLGTAETEKHIAAFLGKLTKEIYGILGFHGLILTGGDTAFGVASSLKATGTVIKEEVLPGIPKCYFTGTVFGDIPVITKAGGFGGKGAVARMIEFLERTM
ncbi:four-carbon acid sugar kinase family protein [Candidatus Latescibacterota bacterium]